MADKSEELDDKLKQDEAQKFSIALLENQAMLVKYLKVLAQPADNPDQKIEAANTFIQNKSENGVADYQTDLAYVLQAQQTMPTYMLIYWSGFYKTTIGKIDSEETWDGESFVIAATLNPDDPIHLGVGRTNIISPTFNSLILRWDKIDGIQATSAELVFNLVPDTSGNFVKTFAGTYDDGTGEKLFTGIVQPQLDKEKEKFSLPPALQVLFPTIAAIGGIIGAVGASLGMAWTIRQWKDRSIKANEAAENVRNNPQDPNAQTNLESARTNVENAQSSVTIQAPALQQQATTVSEIPLITHAEAAKSLIQMEPNRISPNDLRAIADVMDAIQHSSNLRNALKQLSDTVDTDSSDGGSLSVEVSEGTLSPEYVG